MLALALRKAVTFVLRIGCRGLATGVSLSCQIISPAKVLPGKSVEDRAEEVLDLAKKSGRGGGRRRRRGHRFGRFGDGGSLGEQWLLLLFNLCFFHPPRRRSRHLWRGLRVAACA